jgi:hypothetical protein
VLSASPKNQAVTLPRRERTTAASDHTRTVPMLAHGRSPLTDGLSSHASTASAAARLYTQPSHVSARDAHSTSAKARCEHLIPAIPTDARERVAFGAHHGYCRARPALLMLHPTDGRTRSGNLMSLCRFHHRRHHEGRFRIERDTSGDFIFVAEDGRPLVPVVAKAAFGRLDLSGWDDSELARARDGGAPYDREYAIAVIADGIAFNRAAVAAREGPAP